jgi:rSAM/selenodomain-associated transferase 1
MQLPREVATNHNALAIVAKYPRAGFVKTRLGVSIGHDVAAALYRAFLGDLSLRFGQEACRNNYDLLWACAVDRSDSVRMQECLGNDAMILYQRGVDFAERLYHITVDLQVMGYQRIVIMSSDSPQLSSALVRVALQQIVPDNVVLGPAEDGGYYLIGFDVASAVPDLFRGIEMSTPQVLAATLARVRRLGLAATLLPCTFDVDDIVGLLRLAEVLEGPTGLECPHTKAVLDQLDCQVLLESGSQYVALR